MHRMMRSEPSCGKTKLHGQKDKVHDLKGMVFTKLSQTLIFYFFLSFILCNYSKFLNQNLNNYKIVLFKNHLIIKIYKI